MKKKDYARALADLDQSIEAHPTISGYLVRGALHETQGRCSLAMADYRQARELKPAGTLEADAQVIAKSRLDQYARRKSCGPAGEHRLAEGHGRPMVGQDEAVAPIATADAAGVFRAQRVSMRATSARARPIDTAVAAIRVDSASATMAIS
jgi:hypothetical protein